MQAWLQRRAAMALLLWLWSGFSAWAAVGERWDFGSRLWRTDDGLPNNFVQAIAQTRDDYLWVGTREGLGRFDGIHFQTFPELPNVSITALAEDGDGILWVGTDGAGTLRWHAGHTLPPLTGAAPTNVVVMTMLPGRDGAMWVGTTDGLWQFPKGEAAKIFYRHQRVRSLSMDAEGTVWAAIGDGSKKYQPSTRADPAGIKSVTARVVLSGQNGALWVGSSGGVNEITRDEPVALTKKGGLAADMVSALFEDHAGDLWVGTFGGLNCLTPDGALHEVKRESEALDPPYAIMEDREGNLWVGTREGLHRLKRKVFTTFTRQNGLAHNNITSVMEDKAGRIWIGTWGGGLHVMENGVITQIPMTTEWRNDLILGLTQDRAGNLWVGTDFEGGMFRYEKGQFFHYWKNQGISLLADPSVRVIMEDGRTHRIWVGTDRALNVARRSFPFQRYTTNEGLGGNTVHAIFEDDEGNDWIGTSGGLTEFQGDNLVNYTTHNGLSQNNITALCEDGEKNLWIGTGGGGLNRFHDGKFTSYTARQGLFSDEIFEVLEDDADRIWMTCGSGIFWVARKELDELDAGKIASVNCVSYGTDDGLATAACNDVAKPSACKSRDGRLWFATVKGLSVVDPNLIPKTNGKAPAVFVEKVLYDGKSFDAVQPLRLAAGRGDTEFQFTALSFSAPERNRFKYKLEGVDHEWVDAGTARSARYNNIGPGNYRFQVIACNSEGVWNQTGAMAMVGFEPQFWQTWWFWLTVVVVVGLLAALGYRAHVARIREMERLRVRIAADLHDEIGSSLGSISLLTRKIEKEGVLIADQKSDLASINRISTQSANSIRDIVWFINPDYDTMQDLLLRMRDAANTRLGGMDISFTWPEGKLSRGLALDFRRDIFLMFKEILGNIAKHSHATEVEIAITDRQGAWRLLVRDNGVGFDPASVRQGNGLGNLRKRAEKMNGALEIKSAVGRGTTVVFSLGRN